MKKPQINLTAIERIDAVPLRKAVEFLKKGVDEIAAARVRESNLKTEIDDYLSTINPDDEKAVGIVAAKKIQLEILPNLIARVERTLNEKALPTLMAETDKFRSELVRFYSAAFASTATQLADLFRPFFSMPFDGDRDPAREMAELSDDCRLIRSRIHNAESVQLPSQGVPSMAESGRVNSLIQAAETLLALAERA